MAKRDDQRSFKRKLVFQRDKRLNNKESSHTRVAKHLTISEQQLSALNPLKMRKPITPFRNPARAEIMRQLASLLDKSSNRSSAVRLLDQSRNDGQAAGVARVRRGTLQSHLYARRRGVEKELEKEAPRLASTEEPSQVFSLSLERITKKCNQDLLKELTSKYSFDRSPQLV